MLICPKVVLRLLFARKHNLNVPIVQKGRLHILTSQHYINKQKANPKQPLFFPPERGMSVIIWS